VVNMFIISNNCAGGWCYRLTNQKYNNPFMWMICPYDSIMYMLHNFYEIDWGKFELHSSPLKHNTFYILVDKHVELHYVHYVFNPSVTTLVNNHKADAPIQENEIEYCRIWEYIVETYIKRVSRMVRLTEPPTFLLYEYGASPRTHISLSEIVNTDSQYKRTIITSKPLQTTNPQVRVICIPHCTNPMNMVSDNLSDIISS